MSSDIVAANSICNVMFQMATSSILGVSNASAVLVEMCIRDSFTSVQDCAEGEQDPYLELYADGTFMFMLSLIHILVCARRAPRAGA